MRLRANRGRRARAAGVAAAALALCAAAATTADAGATTIPDAGTSTLPVFQGNPGYGAPIVMPLPPQNPYLGPNPFNNVHNDAWLSDTAAILGPSGHGLVQASNQLRAARRNPTGTFFVCGTLTFDRAGRIVTPCMGPGEDSLVLIDPRTLKVLAYAHMPLASGELTAYGSAYMFMDRLGRAVVTVGRQAWVMVETGLPGAAGFKRVAVYDFSSAVPEGMAIQSVMPDWQGRLWAMVQGAGSVAVLDPRTGAVRSVQLSGTITNSFAVNGSSAYVVTTRRMYRLTAGSSGQPRVVWSMAYPNIGTVKPGQKSAGSGTSPTLLAGGAYVAINDNAAQMHVVVYRTATTLPRGVPRQVCSVAVFPKGKSASENSLVAWNRSMMIQNTYGYELEVGTWDSPLTQPGLARVDVKPDGSGCRKAWENDQVRIPSVLGKLSTPAGRFYTMTRQDDARGLPTYYWSAINVRTGAVSWRYQAGTGSQWDSYVPALAIGPGGTLYTGVYGGITSLRDRTACTTASTANAVLPQGC